MSTITGKNQQGITLYLSIITLSAALATALFVAGALVKEYKISTSLFNSLKAVYVADSVTEYTLYQVRRAAYDPATQSVAITLPDGIQTLSCTGGVCANSLTALPTLFTHQTAGANGLALSSSTFSVKGQIIAPGSVTGCPASSTAQNCVYLQASGGYGGTNRAIEIVYENK